MTHSGRRGTVEFCRHRRHGVSVCLSVSLCTSLCGRCADSHVTDREWVERRPVAYSRLRGKKPQNHRGVATAVATLWDLEPVREGTYVLDNYEYQMKCRRNGRMIGSGRLVYMQCSEDTFRFLLSRFRRFSQLQILPT